MKINLGIMYIVGKYGPLNIEKIEYEYIAKYGEVNRQTLSSTLRKMKDLGYLSKCKRGVYF